MQPAQRVGPQPGQPPGQRPADAGDRPHPVGAAGGVGDRRRRRRRRPAPRPAGPRCGRRRGGPAPRFLRAQRFQGADRVVEIGVQPGGGGLAGADPLGQRGTQLRQAVPAGGRGGQHRHPGQAVVGQQPAQVAAAGVQGVGVEPVGLVEHHQHHLAVAGQRAQVAPVHRRVGVLLRIEHPDQQVHHAGHPLGLGPVGGGGRVEVRQVHQHQTRPATSPSERRRRRAACRSRISSQSSSSVAAVRCRCRRRPARAPPGTGWWSGRRTPVGASTLAGEGVEQAGLATAGAAGQRHHGAVRRQPAARRCPGQQRPGRCQQLRVAAAARPARTARSSASSRVPSSRSPPAHDRLRGPGGVDGVHGGAEPAGRARRRGRLGQQLGRTGRPRRPAARRRAASSACRARAASERTAWSPKIASSTFWLSAAVPPAIAISPPVRPPVWANSATISTEPAPLTP